MRIVWSLALAQLRHHRGRWAMLAAGIALVVAVPVLTTAMASSVSAQTIRRTIGSLDLTDRTLLVSQEADSSLIKGTHQQNDRAVRAQLARLGDGVVLHELLFRSLTVAGSSFVLGAVDQLDHAVRVQSGRLPTSCTPTRCEVVIVGRGDSPALRRAVARLGAVVVGRVARTNPLLVSGALDTQGAPLVVGADVDAMGRLAKLELFGRHYAWVTPVDADRVVQLGTSGYLARSADVDGALSERVGGTTFDRPDQQLQQAQARADTSAQRFGLLGGFAAVLLLGFAVVAAIGLRRESRLLAGALDRRGATRTQVIAVVLAEVVLACAGAAVLGVVLGAGVGAALSHGTGRSAITEAVRAAGGAATTAALLVVLAGAVAAAVLLWADAQAKAVWRMLDLLAIACLAAALLAADRGSTSAADLASSGDPLVVALPVLASIVAGVVAARLWGPAARLAERVLPRRSVAGRIGLLGAIRRPLRPVATVAFLTAAVASVVFAGAYRATLLANDADQAAYRTPLDATVAASSSDLTPYVRPDAFGADGRVFPVVRTAASVTRLAGVTDSVPVVGVDAAALAHVHRWNRTTGGSVSASDVAARIHARTAALPALSVQTLAFPVRGYDPNSAVTAWLRGSDGREYTVGLTQRGGSLVGAAPRGASPLQLVAIGVDQNFDYATHHAHNIGEGTTDQPQLSGTLTLGPPAGVAGWTWAGWGSLRGTTATAADRLSLTYRINATPVIAAADFAARQAVTLPVVVDPETARDVRGGVLLLSFDSAVQVNARVVATMPRLPSVSGPFVLADRSALGAVFDLREPGRNPTEYWVSAPSSALDATLSTGAFPSLTVTRRDAVQAQLDDDPIGKGARTLLLVVALLALAVAALALVLLVVGERRDGAGELYVWEADGTRPTTLRAMLAIRMIAVAAVGIPVGVVAGLVVAQVGATLVAIDAAGSTPIPPLAVTLGSAWTPAALAVGVGAGLLLGALVAARSLRERFPLPAEADLR